MGEAIFWMTLGAGLSAIIQHVWKNKKIREAFYEEKAAAEKKIRAVKKGLSES